MVIIPCCHRISFLDHRLHGFEENGFPVNVPLRTTLQRVAQVCGCLPLVVLLTIGPVTGWGSMSAIPCYAFIIAIAPTWLVDLDYSGLNSSGRMASAFCAWMTDFTLPVLLLYLRKSSCIMFQL
jgi:hypothetical protein